jgi:hypothetical protein
MKSILAEANVIEQLKCLYAMMQINQIYFEVYEKITELLSH